MFLRVGKVTNVYPSTGRVKVLYEDEENPSMPIAMLTMNDEYSMPTVGQRVITIHMGNGSSKGFVLGTYYGGGTQPRANAGYRKDFEGGAYAACRKGKYTLFAPEMISLISEKGMEIVAVKDITLVSEEGGAGIRAEGASVLVDKETVTIKAKNITMEAENIMLKCAYGEITVEDIMKRLESIETQLNST